MYNLNNGILTIEGIEVKQDTNLDFLEKSFVTNPILRLGKGSLMKQQQSDL